MKMKIVKATKIEFQKNLVVWKRKPLSFNAGEELGFQKNLVVWKLSMK